MEQPKRLLCGLVQGHLVFVLASLLGKRACSIVDPFVAVDLGWALLSRRGFRDYMVNLVLDSQVSTL